MKHEMRKLTNGRELPWFEGKCTNLTRETPYFLFTDLFQNIFKLDLKSDLSEQRKKIKELLQIYQMDKNSDLLIRELLNLPAPDDEILSFDASQKKRATFMAIKALFVSMAKKSPFVAYVEDLQWIDPLSNELLNLIIDTTQETGILLAGSFRTDFAHEWTTRSNFTQVSLSPLTSEQSIELVQGLLNTDSIPPPLAHLISMKTDGNPLYVEEIVKSLMDTGKLFQENDQWKVSHDLETAEIPATVQGIIAARIDRLSEIDKQVLQYASVVGRRFSDALIAKAGEFGEAMYTSLKQLRKKELIFEVSSSADEIVYVFKHALTQDVAYQSILAKTQRYYHQRVAEAIETLFGEDPIALSDYFEALAHHYIQAGVDSKAVEYLQLSGMKMADNFENQGAIKVYSKALGLLDTVMSDGSATSAKPWSGTTTPFSYYAELSYWISKVYMLVGDYNEAERIQTKLLNLPEAELDSKVLGACYRRLGELNRIRGHLDQGLAYLEKSLEYSVKANDAEGIIRTHKSLANTWGDLHNLPKALEFFDKGLDAAKQLDDSRLIAEYFNDLATLYISQSQLEKAKQNLTASIELSSKLPTLKSLLVSSTLNLGVVQYMQNDKKGALAQFREAASTAKQIGDMKNMLISRHNIGEMFLEFGNLEDALKEFEESYQIASEIGHTAECLNNRIFIGYLKTRLNDAAVGIQMLEESVTKSEQLKQWDYFCDANIYLARYLAEQAQVKKAQDILNRALNKAKELNVPRLIERCESELEKLNRNSNVFVFKKKGHERHQL